MASKPTVPALTVNESMVLSCLQAFPKVISPVASKLSVHHLLDEIAGSTALAASDCFLPLTLLDESFAFWECSPCFAPWSQLSFVLVLGVYWPFLGYNKVTLWDLCFSSWFYCSLSIL